MDQVSYQQGVAAAMAAMMGMDGWQQSSGSMGQGSSNRSGQQQSSNGVSRRNAAAGSARNGRRNTGVNGDGYDDSFTVNALLRSGTHYDPYA